MDDYVHSLTALHTLDPGPQQWRHITLQGIGHVEDVTDQDCGAAVGAVARRLARLEPIESTFQVVIFKEAIPLPPSNPGAYAELRNEILAGIADAWGYSPSRLSGSVLMSASPTASRVRAATTSETHWMRHLLGRHSRASLASR